MNRIKASGRLVAAACVAGLVLAAPGAQAATVKGVLAGPYTSIHDRCAMVFGTNVTAEGVAVVGTKTFAPNASLGGLALGAACGATSGRGFLLAQWATGVPLVTSRLTCQGTGRFQVAGSQITFSVPAAACQMSSGGSFTAPLSATLVPLVNGKGILLTGAGLARATLG